MAVSTVGSVVTHGSTANSGSQNITVPSGAKLAVIFWCGAPSSGSWSMSSISLGGVAGVIRSNVVGVFPAAAIGSATVENPPAGTQALTWDYTGSATAAAGTVFIVRFFTADGNIVVADWDAASGDQGTTAQSLTVDSVSDGYVVGMAAGALDVNGAPTGSGQTIDLNNFTVNNIIADLSHEVSPGASTTTWNMTASMFASGAVVSLMEEPLPPPDPPTGLDVTPASSSELAVTWDTEEGDLSYDVRFRRTDEFPPLSVQSSAPWHLERLSQRTRAETNQYLYGYTGDGVRIYIVDSGVRLTHDQFGGRAILGVNTTGESDTDNDGHGTQVASSAAGSTSGTAKGATIVSVKVFNSTSGDPHSEQYRQDYIEGLEWIAANHPAGVRGVVNSSSIPPTAAGSELEQAWQALLDMGLVCVQAAPNDGQEGFPGYPAFALLPEGIIFVGGMREVDEFRPESNYGSYIDIIGPADSLTGLAGHTSDNATINSGGNSNAAPMVAGICALILEENPHASVQRVTEILTQQANIGVLTSMPPNTVNALAYSLASSTDWVTHTDVGSPPYVIDSLEPGTEYEVQVRRTTAAGTSDWSSSALGTTAPETIDLAVGSASHGHTATSPTLVQSFMLSVASPAHGHAAESVDLTQVSTLAPADASHAQFADNVALTQANLLVVQDASHDHASDSIVLTVARVLDVADSAHGHAADSVALTQAHVLGVADAVHGHSADSVDLSLSVLLSVADALHSHGVDNVALTQAHVLAVAGALHGHFAANVVLEHATFLDVDGAIHGHSASGVQLSLADILAAASSIHDHTADEIDLTQQHVLIVSDAVHAQIAELVDVRLPGLAASRDVFMITAEDRIYLIAPETQRVVN